MLITENQMSGQFYGPERRRVNENMSGQLLPHVKTSGDHLVDQNTRILQIFQVINQINQRFGVFT